MHKDTIHNTSFSERKRAFEIAQNNGLTISDPVVRQGLVQMSLQETIQ